MRDYGELVNALKACSGRDGCLKCPRLNTKSFANGCAMSAVMDAADAIEELLAERNRALKRLCEWCGVCSEENRKALECDDVAMLDAPRWISVEERLPEVEQSVLFCVFGRAVGEGTYRGHDGFHHVWKMYAVAGTYWDDEVTHWMPLPSPPKEVE